MPVWRYITCFHFQNNLRRKIEHLHIIHRIEYLLSCRTACSRLGNQELASLCCLCRHRATPEFITTCDIASLLKRRTRQRLFGMQCTRDNRFRHKLSTSAASPWNSSNHHANGNPYSDQWLTGVRREAGYDNVGVSQQTLATTLQMPEKSRHCASQNGDKDIRFNGTGGTAPLPIGPWPQNRRLVTGSTQHIPN